MPGVRAPQPPTSGPPATFSRTRRRNSLPALSSAQLNRLSTNAHKTKTPQGIKNGLPKSIPEENSQQPLNNINEKSKSSSSVNSTKPFKPVAKIIVSKDESLDTNGNELNDENNISPTIPETEESDSNSQVPNGSSVLQTKVKSKTNAVYIFRFEDDDDKSKKTNSSDSSLLSTLTTDKSPKSPGPIHELKSDLSNTWPPETLDINSFRLNQVRFNTLGFCGYKHKQFRDSRKLCHIMTPVQELRTPVNDTEFDLEDEWSVSSSTDYWMDTRSSNGSSSPGTHRGRDEFKRRTKPVHLNANSNTLLGSETDSNLSSNLRSALSLSPRRNSRNTLNAIRTSNSKSKSSQSTTSSQRLRSDLKGGSSESKVGHIFNSLRQNGNNTSKSSSISNGDDFEPRTQLPARLQARRRSLSSLPDLVKTKGTTSGLLKR